MAYTITIIDNAKSDAASAGSERGTTMSESTIKEVRYWKDQAAKQDALAEGYTLLGRKGQARRAVEKATAYRDRVRHLEASGGKVSE